MNKAIRFGIVGCGVIAATHADAIEELGDALLTACCDIDAERADAFASRYCIAPQNCSYSINSLLDNPEVDAISICTPSGTHSELAIACLTAGKPVIVEKPMDVTLGACSLLTSVQRETGLAVSIISQHRFDASSVYAHQHIESGDLGTPILCEAQIKWHRTQEYYDSGDWRGTWEFDGGGALMNQGIHTVDLMLWMMGSVDTVYAVARTLTHDRIEVEDVICATLAFENGSVGNLVASTAVTPGFPAQLSIHGSLGTIVITGDALSTVNLGETGTHNDETASLLSSGQARHALQMAQGGTKSAESQKIEPTVNAGTKWGDAHRAQFADFIESIQTGRTPKVNCQSGMEAVRVILAAYESARTGKIVSLR
jgi:UDP-N-acetyl-2-amino-2-deoxyglucuronate dehydrogenase